MGWVMLEKIKILLIEDDIPLAQTLLILLAKAGCDVQVVHTGKKGLQRALETKFDLIVLAWIFHSWIEQRSGESVRRLENTEPNENATHRFF